MALEIRPEASGDREGIRALLSAANLPIEDLETSRPYFIVACSSGLIVGTGALQTCGHVALLRSVAVAGEFRKTGLGRRIVGDLERIAQKAGVGRVILLTTTAPGFFQGLDYAVIDRKSVPEKIQETPEFRSLCPASAVCMSKHLAQHTRG
jgi:amino-acid N-acetyltransferase